jgi:hypothetical protein
MYGLLFKSLVYDVPVIKKANVNMVAINNDSQLKEKE